MQYISHCLRQRKTKKNYFAYTFTVWGLLNMIYSYISLHRFDIIKTEVSFPTSLETESVYIEREEVCPSIARTRRASWYLFLTLSEDCPLPLASCFPENFGVPKSRFSNQTFLEVVPRLRSSTMSPIIIIALKTRVWILKYSLGYSDFIYSVCTSFSLYLFSAFYSR